MAAQYGEKSPNMMNKLEVVAGVGVKVETQSGGPSEFGAAHARFPRISTRPARPRPSGFDQRPLMQLCPDHLNDPVNPKKVANRKLWASRQGRESTTGALSERLHEERSDRRSFSHPTSSSSAPIFDWYQT